MEWKGDEERLGQLCQLFQLASSPDNRVQQQVMQMLQQFSQLPDFNMYLATVFAKLTNQDEVVRQRAGLLLKTNVGRVPPGTLQPAVAEYVQAHALSAVRDSSKVIRHTAGTVISILVLKVGILGSRSTLDQLAGCLGDPNANTVEGSFNALNKICEDGMMLIKQTWDYPDQETQHFVSWSAENLLPKVMQYASPQAPLHARQNAIECLNHFALNWAFNEPKFPQLQPFAGKYLEVLGVLANDQDPNVLKDVCKGFVCVIENQWTCVTPQTASVVLQYMLKACKHPEYMVRVEALEVWTPCTNSPMLVQCVWSLLNDLIPVLLENMVYSQADYMAMEHAMWEDDNAAVPDAAQDIKPRTHKAGSSLVNGVQFTHEEVEARTVMYNVKPGDRTRPHGGARHVFRMNRKPVLAYSVADTVQGLNKVQEAGGSVLRRLRVMMDEEYVNMASLRQQYFRPANRVGKWRADYNMRLARRKKLRRIKEQFDRAWDQWMRTEGRRQGLTEPVPFNGPKLGMELTEELDTASNVEDVTKALPTKQELRMNKKYRPKGWSKYLPEDVFPGQWNDEGEDSIHKLFKRPLHKYPFDIGKRGTNHVVRGIVF